MSSGTPSARPRAAPIALPSTAGSEVVGIARWLPSGRSLLLGFTLAALGVLGYLGARDTSVFAVRSIVVSGAPPRVAAHVRAALAPLRGQSLVGLSSSALARRLAPLPDVARASYDRAFPHTLRVSVIPEWPAALARRAAERWIVATTGRVIGKAAPGAGRGLPIVWLGSDSEVTPGARLRDPLARRAVDALALLRFARIGARVRFARSTADELTLVLRSGSQVRLGGDRDLALKLAIVRRVLPLVHGDRYLDVSAPDRPVAGR